MTAGVAATLNDELAKSIANVETKHIRHLIGLGVPPSAIAEIGARQPSFGVLRIEHGGDGLFWPAETGFTAMVLPVLERSPRACLPSVVDLVAFRSARPSKWWWRIGAGALLGSELLSDHWLSDPLLVVSTPVAWLRAAGEAVCILNWDCSDFELSPLRDRQELRCDTAELAAKLRDRLMKPKSVPRIVVRAGDFCDAA